MALVDDRLISWLLNGDATDSDSGYNGTASGVSYAAGKIKNCAIFDGTNDYISLPEISELDNSTAWSLSFWFYADSWDEGARLFEYSDGTNRISVFLTYDGATLQLRFQATNGTTTRNVALNNPIAGNWHHFIVVRRQSGSLHYYNAYISNGTGYNSNSTSGALTLDFSSPSGCIGSNYDHSVNFFAGKIEQICFWNAATLFDSTDRATIYNSDNGLPWPFGALSAGALQSVSNFLANYHITSLLIGPLQSGASLTGGIKQTDLFHLWATVSHDDGGEYNPAGIVQISESGYKIKEILWSGINAAYTDY